MKIIKNILIPIYILLTVCMGYATITEKLHGTQYVSEHIYGAWWFTAMWAFLCATGTVYFLKRHVRNTCTILLHLSFVVILFGAMLTSLTSKQGKLHLRQDIPTNWYYATEGNNIKERILPFTVRLDDFKIIYRNNTSDASDYVTKFTIEDNGIEINGAVSMNNIYSHNSYRLCQSSYDSDMQGSMLTINYDPYGIPITYIGYALLFLSLIYMLLDSKGTFWQIITKSPPPHAAIIFLLAILAPASYLVIRWHFGITDHGATPLPPILNTPLLNIHVGIIMTAYAMLSVTFFCGITAMAFHAISKHHHIESLFLLSRLFLYPALTCLGLGIFIGAIWANISWGRYWSWDPKETWALITFMVYAVPVHTSSLPFFRNPLAYHIYLVIAFLTLLMTYFGVNYILGGMHSYA